MVHEWAHYRWGVFEEYGFPDDKFYPYFYKDESGNYILNGCYENGSLVGKYV